MVCLISVRSKGSQVTGPCSWLKETWSSGLHSCCHLLQVKLVAS